MIPISEWKLLEFSFFFFGWKRWQPDALLLLLSANFCPGTLFGQLRFQVTSSVLTSFVDSADFHGMQPLTVKIGFDNKKLPFFQFPVPLQFRDFISEGSQED